ncbi:hypothetical protein [Streptomyces lavendofoliae]|uniref:Uncharacterized protein n=1 Tax=Streptomyces lavendofoliae TaxID=67314 RepID=A0A918M709_9ACTN|nr:hypothetical protein [Streptomyces lavendofoliae]GGU62085.1 hypothetical protein GCM10010274_58570 [Streptomyces lavendofoliae]
MNAREAIRRYVNLLADSWTPREKTDERVEQVYAAVRSEVLHDLAADADDHDGHITAQELRRMADAASPNRKCGQTKSISGADYPPCALAADHQAAYCRSADGQTLFLAARRSLHAAS